MRAINIHPLTGWHCRPALLTSWLGKAWWQRLALACLLAAGLLSGHAAYMHAKAWLAQYLIADAWQHTLAGDKHVKPWSWADTWPVAKLTTPAGNELYVLAGLTGESMAFGPAMPVNGIAPGHKGTTIIAGHKNTVFRFLEDVKVGQVFSLQVSSGQVFRYRVTSLDIANSQYETIPMQTARDALLLITCYPFGTGHWDSPLRYLVKAVRV